MSREKAMEARITEYLSLGGLFNPEQMEHEKVRDLLIDCRAYLSALVPDEVAGTASVTRTDILREWFGGDRYARDYDYLDANFGEQADRVLTYLASTLTALAARAEKAAEAEAWERRAGEAIMGEAAAVERITTLEAENAALRARLEEADLDMGWVTTAHVFCDRLGIERKADAEHIASAIARLEAENRDLRAKLETVEAETRERCAKVADRYVSPPFVGEASAAHSIASIIRNLEPRHD